MHKSGFVNIIGKPNVGKSTLVNQLVGEKMNIITHKPQTTRHRIFSILNTEDYQIVLSDSPGIIKKASYKMQDKMNRFAYSSFEDADILLFVIDVRDLPDNNDPNLLSRIKESGLPIFLVVNKIDIADKSSLESHLLLWKEALPDADPFLISAREKIGLDILMENILSRLPEGPPYYPKDQISDRAVRFYVSEIIREKILMFYEQEIPYSCEVVIESYKEPVEGDRKNITRIESVIYVARKSQKNIVIGHKGESIKKLGIASRLDIEKFIEGPVFLQLFVKVKEDWRDDEFALKSFGYSKE